MFSFSIPLFWNLCLREVYLSKYLIIVINLYHNERYAEVKCLMVLTFVLEGFHINFVCILCFMICLLLFILFS